MLGFETIGNATLTVFDESPILTTDPWIIGKPYFGSWDHRYEIPEEQLDNIKKCKYVWLSHGHPDHIDPGSIEIFSDKTILIADHYGERIFNDLSKRLSCIKLKSNEWFSISKNIKIKTFADWNQDSCLLVHIDEKNVLLNLNDGQAFGWSSTIKKILSNYENKFLFNLNSWGDADMINLYDENDNFINPIAADQDPCGVTYNYLLKKWNCNYCLPFSSLHAYSREDSVKMNKFVTPLEKHTEGFDISKGNLLPAFISWDVKKKDYKKINPPQKKIIVKKPEDFGDNYSDQLNKEDKDLVKNYFDKFENIKVNFGFLQFIVGGSEFNIKYSNKKQGLRFFVPRNSLITAIKNNIFDDLLIGNFMKIQVINIKSLYPNFTPYVAKYGDNGFSYSKNELANYFKYYKLNSSNFWLDFLKIKSEDFIRINLINRKKIYFFARKIKRKLL